MEISLIVPVLNEEQNLERLYQKIVDVLSDLDKEFELIFVDDGSTDQSFSVLERLAAGDPRVTVIRFARNFGQTAAMAAGFKMARGNVIIPMDADLQNDPADIPAILRKLDEGYDVVSCWRKERRDRLLTRRLPSVIANKLISWISGVHLHDFGCTLKGYRREVMQHVKLYGEMHRFIPILAHSVGASVAEITVRHHPRQFGESKYGMMRTFKVALDLITIKFLGKYSTKPMHFFGGTGFLLILAGVITAAVTLMEKLLLGVKAHRNPLLLGSVFFVIIGMQCILIGLIAELMTRTYHESQDKPTYLIRQILSTQHRAERALMSERFH
ncbi:MAG TPA: glycosyltransferase family 2 protein [Acidobacteriota bacterium]|nr:glycosyltransferase family 2 protein [Acidobacteriota bacterium]